MTGDNIDMSSEPVPERLLTAPPHSLGTASYSISQPATYRSGLSVAALVLGIVSISFNVALIPGILAWVFGALASRDARRAVDAGWDARHAYVIARVGMILGIVMTAIVLLGIIAAVVIPIYLSAVRGY